MPETVKRKARFSLLDLIVQVRLLKSRLGTGSRVVNVYGLDARTFLLKLSVPPASSGPDADATAAVSWQREYLLIESGVRIHTTRFARQAAVLGEGAQVRFADAVDSAAGKVGGQEDADDDEAVRRSLQRRMVLSSEWGVTGASKKSALSVQSGLTLKLRKHLRTRRLADIRQLGTDRVIDMHFVGGSQAAAVYRESDGTARSQAALESHLIVEFYAGGNVILTDGEYKVLAVQRVFRPTAAVAAGARHRPTDATADRRPAQAAVVGEVYDTHRARQLRVLDAARLDELLRKSAQEKDGQPMTWERASLVRTLTQNLEYGPELVEHAVITAGAPGSDVEAFRDLLLAAFAGVDEMLRETQPHGYILLTPASSEVTSAESALRIEDRYAEVTPLLLAQNEALEHQEYATFDEAVDEYFARLEEMRFKSEAEQRQKQAQNRLNRTQNDIQSRVQTLQQQAEEYGHHAQLIEYHLQLVDDALQVIRAAVASGIPWSDLQSMVAEERRRGNPIAEMVQSLRLERNEVTLLLPDELEAASEDEAAPTPVSVTLNLDGNAHGNAQRYYEARRKATEKEHKTIDASDRALKAAQSKALKVLRGQWNAPARGKRPAGRNAALNTVTEMRKPLWFEKFRYFISSENFLVIAGRDAQQNEMLVKRYLEDHAGDVYMHADVHGAASVVIKGRRGTTLPPPLTLQEAAVFCVACSAAWNDKIPVDAFWVLPSQVSKSAPSGTSLATGSFVVRGRKNMIPVMAGSAGSAAMVMGLGFYFRLAPASVAQHLGERPVRSEHDAAVLEAVAAIARSARENDREEAAAAAAAAEADGDEERAASAGDAESSGELDVVDGNVEAENGEHVTPTDTGESIAADDTADSNFDAAAPTTLDPEWTQRPAPVRGKKGKIRKWKAKYAEQSEEERAAALALLGAKPMRMMQVQEAARRSDTAAAVATTGDAEASRPAHPTPDARATATQPASSTIPRSRPGVLRDAARFAWHQQEQREIEAALQAAGEAVTATLSAEQRRALSELDFFTGQPAPTDTLEYAIPVCAPYQALTHCKYKVKLLPGTLKKGKAVKQAMEALKQQHQARRSGRAAPTTAAAVDDDAKVQLAAEDREWQRICALDETLIIQQVIGNVRVQAPGLHDARHASKQRKKQASART